MSGRRAWTAHPRGFLALAVIAVAGVPLGIAHVTPITAEMALFCLAVLAAAVTPWAEVTWLWSLWLGAVVVLDDLRTFQRVGGAPNAGGPIALERRLLGGRVPTVDLQAHLATPGALGVHDVVLSCVYLLHSPAPLLCGAALYAWRRDLFVRFVATLLGCATVGLAVYLAYPETPPWLASQEGLLPPVRRLTSEVIAHIGPLDGVYGGADPLPNAAMPSLHVAYPVVVAYWTVAAFGRRALPVVLYPAAVAFGVVYLGEHYVIDVIAGVAVAVAALVASLRLPADLVAAPATPRVPEPVPRQDLARRS